MRHRRRRRPVRSCAGLERITGRIHLAEVALMVGIVAYVGDRPAAPLVFQALGQLEYRGHDSAGIAVRTPEGILEIERAVGPVSSLTALLVRPELQTSCAAVAHTRWATHGRVSETNAHPFVDCTETIAIAHNGVISNAEELRRELVIGGHHLISDVDSEVIAHLIEESVRKGAALADALERAATRLKGTWAVVALDARTGQVAATAHRSPLILATTEHGAFLASDISALADRVDSYQVLREGDVVELSFAGVAWPHAAHDTQAPHESVRWHAASAPDGAHDDHLGNEIDEQPAVARRILDAHAGGVADGSLWRTLGLPSIDRLDRVVVVGCGASLHAGMAVGRVFSQLGRVPVHALVASEAGSYVCEPRTLVLAVSRSGETTDVLQALDELRCTDRTVLAITNNPSSTLALRADAAIDCRTRPGFGLTGTRTFTSQVVTGAAVALSGLAGAGVMDAAAARSAIDALFAVPQRLTDALEHSAGMIPVLAEEFASAQGFVFLGRGSGGVYAAEGALMLTELTHRWAQHQPAGGLHHGTLALVEHGTPVFAVDSGDARLEADLTEVTARGGRIVRIGPGSQGEPAPRHGGVTTPAWGPLEAIIPLQLFARSLALRIGRPLDRPLQPPGAAAFD